jgi:hypothetical protein
MNKTLKELLVVVLAGIILGVINLLMKNSEYSNIEYIVTFVFGAFYGIVLNNIK